MVHNGFPPGAMICALWLVVLDLPLIVPIISAKGAASKRGSATKIPFSIVSVTLLRWIAFVALNAWFWYHGFDVHNDAQCQEPRVFFFANFSAYGNIRTLFKCQTTINCFVALILLWKWAVQVPHYIRRDNTNDWAGFLNIDSKDIGDIYLLNFLIGGFVLGFYGWIICNVILNVLIRIPSGDLVAIRILLNAIGGGLILALCILPMELQIAWNKLDGVDGISSTGQVLALIIGSFSLIRAIFLVWILYREDETSQGQAQDARVDVEEGGTEVHRLPIYDRISKYLSRNP